MSIKKRGQIWWIDIQSPDGERFRQSTKTKDKRKAEQLHDKIKHELWEVSKLDKKPSRLFEDAIVLMLKDGINQARFDYKQAHAEYFLNAFAGRELSSITGEEISNSLPTHNINTKKPVSPATANRYRTTILRAFSLAYKLGWIKAVPYVHKLQEPKVRIRWITKGEAIQLINNLKLDWMKNVCRFALLTGARMSEILSLTWSNVDFQRRIAIITSDNAKSGRARALPLNDDAVALLRSVMFQPEYVFTRETKKRITEVDRRDFNRACKLSNIENFHFHDLRHTWASWHVQSGTQLFALKEMGGWETLEMVKKYAHLNINHMVEFANNVTFTAQNENIDVTNANELRKNA